MLITSSACYNLDVPSSYYDIFEMCSNNIADSTGGGAHLWSSSSSITLSNNIISDNNSTGARGGGGWFSTSSGTVTLTNHYIIHNSGQDGAGGIHLDAHSGSITLSNNIISNNYSTNDSPGGIYFNSDYLGSLTLTNNTIVNNNSNSDAGGVKIRLYDDGAIVNIYNNIIWNNIAGNGAGDDLYIENDGNNNSTYSSVNLLNNNFNQQRTQPNQGFFITENDFDIDPSNLNNVDPEFDIDGYHLTGISPCIDAGVDAGVYNDIDGDTRPQGAGYDIGADEYVISDSDGDGIPDDVDACPNSNLSSTVIIDGWDTGVGNVLLEGGCTISDLISKCAEEADNHDEFVSSVSHTTNSLTKDGIISGKDKGMIQQGAAKAAIP